MKNFNESAAFKSVSSQADILIAELSRALPSMTPELKKAATYVINNAIEVGVSSIREIAQAAKVKPFLQIKYK